MEELALVEEPHVIEAVAEAHASYPRFHDLWDALTWRLCRDPYPEGAREIEPEIFQLKSFDWAYEGYCVITLVYTVDEEAGQIIIEDMWVDGSNYSPPAL